MHPASPLVRGLLLPLVCAVQRRPAVGVAQALVEITLGLPTDVGRRRPLVVRPMVALKRQPRLGRLVATLGGAGVGGGRA